MIKSSQITVEIREIELNNKPKEFLKLSPKGTVPVLILDGNNVIDESIDIMFWAFKEKRLNNLEKSQQAQFDAFTSSISSTIQSKNQAIININYQSQPPLIENARINCTRLKS